ncbi:MAG: AAA family ATPase [Candidatus Bathyarchaeota archaeon]|nr:AAA family ATPase [Candidatus Bathyarchaeota archaeon]
MRHKIGLAYLPGALPCFEAFGNLPTDLVRENGFVAGRPASEALDMLIVPGGSLVESQTVKGSAAQEILKMADAGKFVLGICSGFQILSRGTDIGRLSATPIFREGLGLIDAEFSPLICTDQVKATIVGASCLTDQVGTEVTGFHCHTYGKITPHKNAKPILVSHVKRLNYHKNIQDLTSGISNKEGNVVGILTHALLDQNPAIIQGITRALDINEEELAQIRTENAKLQKQIQNEVGVATNIYSNKAAAKTKMHKTLLVTALGSGSGKTFIVTGLAGALKKRGVKVGVVKVGGDIRDVVPTLYLIKEPIRNYSSIKIGESGWNAPLDTLKEASRDYECLIIEGAMSTFTGLLMDKVKRPSSTAEVAAMLGVPTVVVAGCEKEGVEGAMVSILSYVRLMQSLGVNVKGVILNKMLLSYLTDEIRQVIKRAFSRANVELLGIVPRINLEGRGAIPEIEIKYEEFGAKAIEIAENSMDLDKIVEVAAPAVETHIDSRQFSEKFKNSLETNLGSDACGRGEKEDCL